MKQSKALAILKSGKNVFLTGSAGAGKTYVLNQYISYLKERNIKVAITASTGIAATHMNGMTIHAWSGMGIKDDISPSDMKNMKTKKYLTDNLDKVQVLIIDEISMLHKNQLELVQQILRYFKNNGRAFGGVQVIFSGDFFQLPPIGKNEETSKDKFAFMAKAWLDAELHVCYITEQHRQNNDNLNIILNEIRNGTISENAISILENTQNNNFENDGKPTRLFTHNVDVNKINEQHLSEIDNESIYFKASTKGNPTLLETLKKAVLAEEHLELKKGAKVMFVKNNYEKGYINGSIGVVIDFYTDEEDEQKCYPKVILKNGNTIIAKPEKWIIEDDSGKPLATFEQIPVRLAWAITVHKSQGMTLDTAEIDLSKTFEKGQGYVALSRLKSINGLRLIGLNEVALQVDEWAKKADFRFRELSDKVDHSYFDEELEKEAIQFIEKCGGLTNPKEIEQHKQKVKEKKLPKKSTYLITKELVENGKNVVEIAKERGVSDRTIINHLIKIKELYPETNFNSIKPPDSIIAQVQKTKNLLQEANNPEHFQENGTLKRSPIFEHNNGEISYENINLAMLFLK